MMPLDRTKLFAQLNERGLTAWVRSLQTICESRFDSASHGTLSQWIDAWHSLPDVPAAAFDASTDVVTVQGSIPDDDLASLRPVLMQFHPWRKGPFDLFGTLIDSEWRSDLKWHRLADAVDFRGKTVLDVGCGNGYYGWKMVAAGADLVIGCDPSLLFTMQFEVFRRYAPRPECHFVVPISDTELPARLHAFDVACSMGVLYHRTSPIDHLKTLWQALHPNGTLVLETLVIEDNSGVLIPEDRYAMMRNVWFIPSLSMLELWLRRTGFGDINVVNVTPTTSVEQRRTEWMRFESLVDFLDPSDSTRTIEGHPAPVRALLTARRK
jgi:tRNA (mo5U34)-methyltransferase